MQNVDLFGYIILETERTKWGYENMGTVSKRNEGSISFLIR